MINEKIEIDFAYHPPEGNQADLYQDLRWRAKSVAYVIDEICPDSFEKETAMMKLNEVVFWANAAIARYGGK